MPRFQVGDLVRVRTEELSKRTGVDSETGKPRTYGKWVGPWAIRAEIVADDGRGQYVLQNTRTGRLIWRSAAQLAASR